jgi:AraC-like DNA-binding protein
VVRYREIAPSPQLSTFIHSFWILEHDGQGAAAQRVVPDGHSELILNWGQPFEAFEAGHWRGQPRCFLAGQIDGPLLFRPAGPARMLGIGFHPHGAGNVFPQPMHELSGRFTPVEDLSVALSRNLNRALESPDPVAAIEAALLSAANASRGTDLLIAEVVRRIILANGATDLAALAQELGLSLRQLERRFLAAVGLGPKLFCRIQRFNNVFGVMGQPSCNWVETAVACGYYDQAHLIRDCKDLSGATPAILLAKDADLARHFYLQYSVSHSSNTRCRASV